VNSATDVPQPSVDRAPDNRRTSTNSTASAEPLALASATGVAAAQKTSGSSLAVDRITLAELKPFLHRRACLSRRHLSPTEAQIHEHLRASGASEEIATALSQGAVHTEDGDLAVRLLMQLKCRKWAVVDTEATDLPCGRKQSSGGGGSSSSATFSSLSRFLQAEYGEVAVVEAAVCVFLCIGAPQDERFYLALAFHSRVRPLLPISAGLFAVHGISQEEAIRTGKDPQKVLESIWRIFQYSDVIAGFNIYFDLFALLRSMLLVLGSMTAQAGAAAAAPTRDLAAEMLLLLKSKTLLDVMRFSCQHVRNRVPADRSVPGWRTLVGILFSNSSAFEHYHKHKPNIAVFGGALHSAKVDAMITACTMFAIMADHAAAVPAPVSAHIGTTSAGASSSGSSVPAAVPVPEPSAADACPLGGILLHGCSRRIVEFADRDSTLLASYAGPGSKQFASYCS
jgi:DNA polymerase III epsilon subunit-like protein